MISDPGEADIDYERVLYRKIFLDGEDIDDPAENEEGSEESEKPLNYQDGEDTGSHHTEEDYHDNDRHYSDESYHYSDDHENYSEHSDHDADSWWQEAG